MRPAAPEVLDLDVLEPVLWICRLPPEAPMPGWSEAPGAFFSVTRTAEELSIVCPARALPAGIQAQGPFRALKVMGPLPFEWVGILAALSSCLAKVGLSIFAISTFDTDYLLVKEEDLPAAKEALAGAGHRVH